MQQVVELRQQHIGTAQHVEMVNQRLQAAEQRQKKTVSFLAKLFQSPDFVARLRERKEQRQIGSARMRRKFIKHHEHEPMEHDPSTEVPLVKYKAELGNVGSGSTSRSLGPSPLPIEASMNSSTESVLLHFDTVRPEELQMSGETIPKQGFGVMVPVGSSNLGEGGPFFKGKSIATESEQVPEPDYFVSFPEDLVDQRHFLEFPEGVEGIVKQGDVWSMGLGVGPLGIPSSSSELLLNISPSDEPESGLAGAMSDMWDFGSLQMPAGSVADKWPDEETSFDEHDSSRE